MCACLVFYSQLSGSGTVYTRAVCCAVHETAPGGTFRNKRDLLQRRQPPANEAVISIHGNRARPCVTKTPENSTARWSAAGTRGTIWMNSSGHTGFNL